MNERMNELFDPTSRTYPYSPPRNNRARARWVTAQSRTGVQWGPPLTSHDKSSHKATPHTTPQLAVNPLDPASHRPGVQQEGPPGWSEPGITRGHRPHRVQAGPTHHKARRINIRQQAWVEQQAQSQSGPHQSSAIGTCRQWSAQTLRRSTCPGCPAG